jgi:hypothetical protein
MSHPYWARLPHKPSRRIAAVGVESWKSCQELSEVQNSDAYGRGGEESQFLATPSRNFSFMCKFFSPCTHSPGGSMRSFAFSTGARRMLFITFINRAVQATWRSHHEGRKQARNCAHSPFRGPARGRSPRARISLLAPFQLTGSSTDSRSSSVTLAPTLTWKSASLIHIRCRMPASLRARRRSRIT